MRRIINSTYITLDGVIANPQDWPSGRMTDDAGTTIQRELLFSCDALLMGRKTYDSFAAVWPTRSGDPISDRINSMAPLGFGIPSHLSLPSLDTGPLESIS
jgi:dihydrofolate reductase